MAASETHECTVINQILNKYIDIYQNTNNIFMYNYIKNILEKPCKQKITLIMIGLIQSTNQN